jgi:hypothetical protein
MQELELKDVKAFAIELGDRAEDLGCTYVIALSHPTSGWYVRVGGRPSFEALGLAHQAVRSCQAIIDRCKAEAGTEGDV